ncbi:hypothetical protein SCHPADRAFT_899136 [Schizopora paradoxa]|uniref:Secreted protein n=1 Tax=Schizopora paradoxa TaxID=27342 RepID=A0A0H2S458_9AGAM|nr:hypothetical protein SCHPADRAFT_899136 [Schizopora paradoxa]
MISLSQSSRLILLWLPGAAVLLEVESNFKSGSLLQKPTTPPDERKHPRLYGYCMKTAISFAYVRAHVPIL